MSFLFSSAENEPSLMKLSPVKSNIEEANKHIQALCERVAQLESDKEALADQFQQKQSEFESLKRTLDQCQERLSHRDIQTKNLELTAASREEIILELESHLVAHQRESQTKSEALTSLEVLLAEKETVFERISSKVTEYQKVLEVKNQLLEAATENAAKLEEENVSWKLKENSLRERIEILEKENLKLTKDQELKNSRSTIALEKILAYSSSIEELVGTLREASEEPEKGEEEKKEKLDVSSERALEVLVDAETERQMGHAKQVELVADDLPESAEVITNGWSEGSPDASADVLPDVNEVQILPDHFVDEVTHTTVSLDENSLDTHRTIFEVTDQPSTTHESGENLDDANPEENPFPVTSAVLKEAPSRKRGEDRIASILLFDSAETAINGNGVDIADDDDGHQESFVSTKAPVDGDEGSDDWVEIDENFVAPALAGEVMTNGIFERETYSLSDSDSSKINSTEFFV